MEFGEAERGGPAMSPPPTSLGIRVGAKSSLSVAKVHSSLFFSVCSLSQQAGILAR